MILHAYSIYDNKALVYAVPFFAINDGHAIRSFTDLANDPNTTIGRHPGDFSLYEVGLFDDQHATLVATTPARHVVDALGVLVPGSTEPGLPFPPVGTKRGDELANGEDR